jgi:rhodanese-related sulfurtransferase
LHYFSIKRNGVIKADYKFKGWSMEFWNQYHNIIIMVGLFVIFIFKGKIMGFFFGFKSISAKGASEMLKAGNTTIIDVRTDGEFQSGHIDGAKHIPLHQMSGHAVALGQELSGQKVLVICHTGSRSAPACISLAKQGLTVYNVTGGMMGWSMLGDKELLAK